MVLHLLLNLPNSGSTIPVTVSTLAVAGVVVGDVEYVVAINIEASNGIVYAPSGVCGEASWSFITTEY